MAPSGREASSGQSLVILLDAAPAAPPVATLRGFGEPSLQAARAWLPEVRPCCYAISIRLPVMSGAPLALGRRGHGRVPEACVAAHRGPGPDALLGRCPGDPVVRHAPTQMSYYGRLPGDSGEGLPLPVSICCPAITTSARRCAPAFPDHRLPFPREGDFLQYASIEYPVILLRRHRDKPGQPEGTLVRPAAFALLRSAWTSPTLRR